MAERTEKFNPLNLILLIQSEGNVFTVSNISGTIAFATSLIGLLPQIYKVHKSKSSNDISLLMLINYSICSIAWIIHGILTRSNYVIYSNIFGLLTAIISIFQKLKYSD